MKNEAILWLRDLIFRGQNWEMAHGATFGQDKIRHCLVNRKSRIPSDQGIRSDHAIAIARQIASGNEPSLLLMEGDVYEKQDTIPS